MKDKSTPDGLQPTAYSLQSSIRLGLTGTFGSGKSAVSAVFVEQGIPVIDADALARQAVEPGQPALAEIAGAFGAELIGPDGRLDRRALAGRVFGDRAAATRLNAIIHPRVRRAELAMLEALREAPLVVLDVPLLFEAGMREMVDRVAVVTVSERDRFGRLKERGYSEREVMARLGMQWPQSRKAARADYIIDNSGGIAATREQVLHLLEKLRRETRGA